MKIVFHLNLNSSKNRLLRTLVQGGLFLLITSGVWAQPTVNFSADITSGCPGLTVQFTDATTNIVGIPSYNWNFGSGATPATATTPGPHTVSYANAGTVTVRLTVTDDNGSRDEIKTGFITINPALPTGITISTPLNPICSGNGFYVTASQVNGGSSPVYQWKMNGINVGSNSPTQFFTWAQFVGNGNPITCELTSNAACASPNPTISNAINITSSPSLPVSVSVTASANPVCEGSNVVFTATTVNGGSGPSYQWYVNGLPVGLNATAYSYIPLNGDIVTVVITSNEICTLTNNPATSNPITVSVNPNATVTRSSVVGTDAQTVCQNTAITDVTYSIGGTGTDASVSGLPAGVSASYLSGVLTLNGAPLNSGVYNYIITATGTCGPGTATGSIIVNAYPTITGFTAGSRCGPGTVILNATASTGLINWYADLSGGVSLFTGASFTTPVISTNTIFYVDAASNGCTSPTRTSVQAAINQLPAVPVLTVDCSLGFNHAGITVTGPVGAGYQYRINNGSYQVNPVFTEVINGSYTVTVINPSNCTATGTSFDVSCGCINSPTVTLSSVSGSTCGTDPVTVINNSFGGNATSVTVIENGAGTVSPAGTGTTPFALTYTPAAGDIGNTVTITVTTNNPLGAPCAAAFATYNLTVNAVPTISGTTPGSRCATGTVTLGATASAGTVNWYSASTGGGSIGTGNSFTTPVISATTTYYVDATNNGCTIEGRTPVIATVLQVPPAAGSITGSATFTPGTLGVPYSVASIPGATGYIWGYSGTGVTINGSGTSVTLDFAANATSGQLSVRGTNTCGQGTATSLSLSPSNKTLNLTSVMLEGLYNGSGIMRQAQNTGGAQWLAGVADHITVELHNSSNYATIVWSQTDVSLSTVGTAVITVPAIYNGSYFITVKHRNSIETTTNTPVSFAGNVINRPFSSAASIYGANLRASGDGYYLIFGGDVNQDGFVDSGDYPGVVNDNFNYVSGYLSTDINGDGFIDSGDYPIMVNNNFSYVGTIHP